MDKVSMRDQRSGDKTKQVSAEVDSVSSTQQEAGMQKQRELSDGERCVVRKLMNDGKTAVF